MDVLFVFSGNKTRGISTVVENQAISLQSAGISIHYFPIIGKGFRGYIKNIHRLRKLLRKGGFDLIHCHFSMSGFVGALSFSGKPVICSLMGSDIYGSPKSQKVISLFYRFFWTQTIVKSEEMKSFANLKKAIVVPNGVSFDRFFPALKIDSQNLLGWDTRKRHILFGGDPERAVKNYALAQKAIDLLNNQEIEVHVLKDIPNDRVPVLLNAADMMLLTSHWEGSPNIIKEAMACCCPIVSTRVGDVQSVMESVDGCFITDSSPEDVASGIREALKLKRRTRGRGFITHLEDKAIARTICELYTKLIKV